VFFILGWPKGYFTIPTFIPRGIPLARASHETQVGKNGCRFSSSK